jgi:hypothetical protein
MALGPAAAAGAGADPGAGAANHAAFPADQAAAAARTPWIPAEPDGGTLWAAAAGGACCSAEAAAAADEPRTTCRDLNVSKGLQQTKGTFSSHLHSGRQRRGAAHSGRSGGRTPRPANQTEPGEISTLATLCKKQDHWESTYLLLYRRSFLRAILFQDARGRKCSPSR